MSETKLELYHLAILNPSIKADMTRKKELASKKGEIVLLCKHYPRPQLGKDGREDEWTIRFIDSEQDDLEDLEDRGIARGHELKPLADLSKDELRQMIEELKQLYIERENFLPSWTELYDKNRLTKKRQIEFIEKLWHCHSDRINKVKHEEKQKIQRRKEDREYLLEQFRTMQPTVLGMYVSLIIEQLTDDQVKKLLGEIRKDQRELFARVGPISIFGPHYPH